MLPEQIAKFVETEQLNNQTVKVEFKKRNSINGMFIRHTDYEELKSKNFWRVVTEANLETYNKSKDISIGGSAKVVKKAVAPARRNGSFRLNS